MTKLKRAIKISPFKNKHICITGVLANYIRENMITEIEKAGGIFDKSVSSNTDYLVIADKPGDVKVKAAKRLGTNILTEQQFIDLLRQIERPTLELPPGTKPENPDVQKMTFESRDW